MQQSLFKISICIPTYNRATLIAETLDSILAQITGECEVVISDNASTDRTPEVISRYVDKCDNIRYYRNETNIGPDRNYDRVVELSRGEYCWLMADDDLMKPGAIEAVLNAISECDHSLLVINAERRNFNLSQVLQSRIYDIVEDRTYPPEKADSLAVDGCCLIVVCGLVLKRAVWLSRERNRYYGSMFLHVAIIFPRPLPSSVRIIATPLITVRDGHVRTFWSEAFEILMIQWPLLVWSFPLGDDAKKKITPREPWKDLKLLLFFRGAGWYSFAEYKKFVRPRIRARREGLIPALVSLLPGRGLNALLLLYYRLANPHHGGVSVWKVFILYLKQSRFYIGRSQGSF